MIHSFSKHPLLRNAAMLMALFAMLGTASAAPRFYGGASINWTDIKLDKTHFNPTSGQLHVGGWLITNIGLELRLNSEFSDDSAHGVTTSLPRIISAGLRFQSPEEWGLKAYLLFGGAIVTLDSDADDSGFPGRDDFDAGLASVGFLAPLTADRRFAVFLEASRYFLSRDNDAPLTLGALGVQYEF